MLSRARALRSPTPDALEPGLQLQESRTRDGAVELALVGELDVATGERVRTRLTDLGDEAAVIALDLSQPRFIDCRGLAVIVEALAAADQAGRRLAIMPELSAPLCRLLELIGAAGAAEHPARVALLQRLAHAARAR